MSNKIKIFTDPQMLTLNFYKDLEMIVNNFKEFVEFKWVEYDFVTSFWHYRPPYPNSKIFIHEFK